MKNILITGANRGLGLEFTKQYLSLGHRVIATCRAPKASTALGELKDRFADQLWIEQLDVCQQAHMDRVCSNLQGKIDQLHLLINNAGIGVWNGLSSFDAEAAMKVYQTNAIAPILMARTFLPLLEKQKRSLVVNMGSWLGSTGSRDLNKPGADYDYGMSKTALNLATRQLAADLKQKKIVVVCQSPGWVQTDMGKDLADLTPQESVSNLITLLDRYGFADTGRFFDHHGVDLPY